MWVFRTPVSDIHPAASSSMTCVKVITSRPRPPYDSGMTRAEQAEGGHLVDQLVGIDVVVVEGGCSGHHVPPDEAPNGRHQFGGGGGIDSRHGLEAIDRRAAWGLQLQEHGRPRLVRRAPTTSDSPDGPGKGGHRGNMELVRGGRSAPLGGGLGSGRTRAHSISRPGKQPLDLAGPMSGCVLAHPGRGGPTTESGAVSQDGRGRHRRGL